MMWLWRILGWRRWRKGAVTLWTRGVTREEAEDRLSCLFTALGDGDKVLIVYEEYMT